MTHYACVYRKLGIVKFKDTLSINVTFSPTVDNLSILVPGTTCSVLKPVGKILRPTKSLSMK